MTIVRVMLDLETFGTGPNSAIVQLGACNFYLPSEDKPVPTQIQKFSYRITLQSCLLAGLEIDESTVKWWKDQSMEAKRNLSHGGAYDLHHVLMQFDHWLLELIETSLIDNETAELELWARGTDFDIALLKNAYHKVGLRPAFNYNVGRDVRTLIAIAELAGWEKVRVDPVLAHDALSDCEAQVRQVQLAGEYLIRKGEKGVGEPDINPSRG